MGYFPDLETKKEVLKCIQSVPGAGWYTLKNISMFCHEYHRNAQRQHARRRGTGNVDAVQMNFASMALVPVYYDTVRNLC